MRKTFFISFILIATVLGSLLLLAFNQYKLYGQHEEVIAQTEKFIFQYSIIREQIIEDIVTGNLTELEELSTAVEELHANIIKLMGNTLIPAEYKSSFQQIDLPGLVLLLRRAAAEKGNSHLLQLINQETRVIGERFILFERLVLGYAKQKLVDFQLVIIGTLALIVFLVIMFLVSTYRLLIIPVINLAGQTDEVLEGNQETIVPPQGWQEVTKISERMSELLAELARRQETTKRYAKILTSVQHVLQKVYQHCDRELLCKAVCRALLANPDYVLAWVGITDSEGKGIMPLVADGSSTMSCDECQGCFAALLAEQEGENDPSLKALRSGEIVVVKDILADSPRGPFKNTPLAEGIVDSITFPLVDNEKKMGVLTVYVIVEGGVLDEEMGMLSQVARVLAAKLNLLDMIEKIELDRTSKNIIGEQNNIVTFTLDKAGRIVSMDSYLDSLDYREAGREWIGRDIADIVLPENDSENIILRKSLDDAEGYTFNARLAGFDENFTATLEPTGNQEEESKEKFLMVLIPPQKNMLIQPENFQITYSAAIGQFASSIAHELTDLSNGIINYAQMLSDEMAGEPRTERKRSLEKIIAEGEKVASIVEPLLIDQDDFEGSRSIERVQSIFKDALLLIGPLFKKDCITVNLDMQSPSIQYRKQHLLLILLILLKRLRESLNDRFPNKDPDKILDILVTQYKDNSTSILMISFEFTGRERDYDQKAIQKGEVAGMWLSQELARNLGGDMNITVTDQEKIKVDLLLPI